MPSIPIYPLSAPAQPISNPLPPLLHTPLGLALVEVQGTLNLPAAPPSENESTALPIGRLEFPNLSSTDDPAAAEPGPWTKKVYFYVGERQRLVGEAKKLEKAFAVVRKRGDVDDDDVENGTEELEVLDLVRWRLHFGGRPEFV